MLSPSSKKCGSNSNFDFKSCQCGYELPVFSFLSISIVADSFDRNDAFNLTLLHESQELVPFHFTTDCCMYFSMNFVTNFFVVYKCRVRNYCTRMHFGSTRLANFKGNLNQTTVKYSSKPLDNLYCLTSIFNLTFIIPFTRLLICLETRTSPSLYFSLSKE